MSAIKILHTGDFHIGSSRTGITNGRAEIKNTFFKVLDICKEEHIDLLLIAGDMFDSPFPCSDTVNEITEGFLRIPDTVVAIAPGNHDCACPGSVWLKTDFPDNVYIFTSFSEHFDFPEKNLRLFGAAFTDRFEKIPLLSSAETKDSPAINICVLHGELVSSNSESSYNPITPDSISACGFDYLALGHIHKRSEIQKNGTTFYAYCGCPDGRGFDEDGSRGIYLGTVEKGNCRLEYRELSSRKYLYTNIDISDCETSLGITEKILNSLKAESDTYQNNLYRISLTGTVSPGFSPSIQQIEAKLSEVLSYARVTDNTELNPEDILKLATESSLRGIFVQKMLALTDSSDSANQKICKMALNLGLKAFEREVTLDDN